MEPQVTLGLFTDAAGFPLTVQTFEGDKAESATMLPVVTAFNAAHHHSDVTVIADAGMISEANQIAIKAAGMSVILGIRILFLPDVVREWRDNKAGEAVPTAWCWPSPGWPPSAEKTRGVPDPVIYYQFRADRARRTLRGIDEQARKTERAVDGHAPVKRNHYVQLAGATKSVNRTLNSKTRALAGWKGYTTNLTSTSSMFVIGAYHQPWHIEKSFRMSTHDLQARPIYNNLRDSIEAHLSIVVAAMAVSRHLETQTGWSIKKFVRTARRYRTVRIQPAAQTLTTADTLPDDLRSALLNIRSDGAHQFEPSRDRARNHSERLPRRRRPDVRARSNDRKEMVGSCRLERCASSAP
ncbi:transposase [Mycolicibacterium sp. SCSIO 43805]|uniref:IS1634 family transposase n=1 Tax=Mycolicibacterium sp. SCSIO 43805 TaxID=3378074 RepID=UPI003AB520B3